MIEYWAAIGLACIDSAFREELKTMSNSNNLAPLHDVLLGKYHFRLSRLEVGEIRRIFRQDGIMRNFETLQFQLWGKTCCTAMTYDPDYIHHERKPEADCF
jgi:hypothetical protein